MKYSRCKRFLRELKYTQHSGALKEEDLERRFTAALTRGPPAQKGGWKAGHLARWSWTKSQHIPSG